MRLFSELPEPFTGGIHFGPHLQSKANRLLYPKDNKVHSDG